MKRAELIRKVREDYLDDVSDAPDQDDEGYRWSDAFLGRAIAEAEYEACRRTDLLYDESTAAITAIALVDGTASYALSAKVTRLVAVVYDGAPLAHKTLGELTETYGEQWRADTGEPVAYAVSGKVLRVYPTPSADEDGDALSLEVYRLPLKSFVDEPEIGEEYHEDLCLYAAHSAYKRRDEDTYDPKKARELLQEFNAAFGYPVNALVREHQKRSPASLSIRPDYGYSDNLRNY